MRKIICSLGILAFLISFPLVNIHAQSLEKIQEKIEKMNAEIIDEMLKGDYSASLKRYTEDAFSLPSYSPMIKGLEALKKSSMEMANSPMKITSFELKTKEIIPGGDLYVEVGKYTMTTEMEGMAEPWEDHGKYVTVWEKQKDGSLKIKVETWNTDTNPWSGMGE